MNLKMLNVFCMQQKIPTFDPKLNKHKKNWLHNFNGGILQFLKN
jgi:hypothetical protein